MSATQIPISKLVGREVFDPVGDRVGKVRDFVVVHRKNDPPLVIGIVLYIPGRKIVFLSIGRVTSIDTNQIITTGLVNLTRFQQRSGEELVLEEIRRQQVEVAGKTLQIEDLLLEKNNQGEWQIPAAICKRPETNLFSRQASQIIAWSEIAASQIDTVDPMKQLAVSYSDLHPADLASELLALPRNQLLALLEHLPEGRVADALEEMAESDQVVILSKLEDYHAARILDEMQPDDAADLIAELPESRGEQLLELMEPEEADDLRLLLSYDSDTAGGLMTNDPIILSAGTTVAEGLARIRKAEIAPALAATVFVTLPPLETPTGRFLGIVSFQRMLRHPPAERLGSLIETTVEPVNVSIAATEVSRILASYDLLSVPVVDNHHRLVGAVTVDDVMDYLLPEDWRKTGVNQAKAARESKQLKGVGSSRQTRQSAMQPGSGGEK